MNLHTPYSNSANSNDLAQGCHWTCGRWSRPDWLSGCDVYIGGKVRVSEFMIFLDLQHCGVDQNKLCIISKTVDKLKSTINNKQTYNHELVEKQILS